MSYMCTLIPTYHTSGVCKAVYASELVLIHINFVFGALNSSPTRLATYHTLSVLSRFWSWVHKRQLGCKGHPDNPSDRKKFPTLWPRLILRWLFLCRSRWEWGKQGREHTPLFHPSLDLEKVRALSCFLMGWEGRRQSAEQSSSSLVLTKDQRPSFKIS